MRGARAHEPAADPLLEDSVDRGRATGAAIPTRVAPESREETLRPAPAVQRLDPLRHGLETALALARGELERGHEVLDDAVHVPGVDEQCAREYLRGAGELGQEQRSTPPTRKPRLRLTEHELLRDEVHPVPKRRDHHHVGSPVERNQRGLGDVAVHVLDRCRARSREAAVDPGDEELDLVPLGSELGALEPRRDEHLDHRRRLGARRILLQEALECMELLRDALRVVEPLHPEDEAAAFVLPLELRQETGCLGLRDDLAKAGDVDPDRVDADTDTAPVELHPVGIGVDAEYAQARRPEMARIVADLEADVVRAENSAEKLLTLGEQAVHLGGRERNVEEESDREPGARRRSIAGTSIRWKSCTHTRASGAQCSRIVSAKRSLTWTYRSHASGVIRNRSEK